MTGTEADIKWPSDLQASTTALLKALNELNKEADKNDAQPITSSITSIATFSGGGIAVLGGGTAIVAAAKGLFAYVTGDSQGLRSVFVASSALLGAAVVLAVAIVVRSDLQSRAVASSARRSAQAQIVSSVLSTFQSSLPGASPTYNANYAVKRKNSNDWLAVEGFSWANGNLVAVIDSATSIDHSEIVDMVDLRTVLAKS